jgi:hypothetical protein
MAGSALAASNEPNHRADAASNKAKACRIMSRILGLDHRPRVQRAHRTGVQRSGKLAGARSSMPGRCRVCTLPSASLPRKIIYPRPEIPPDNARASIHEGRLRRRLGGADRGRWSRQGATRTPASRQPKLHGPGAPIRASLGARGLGCFRGTSPRFTGMPP